MIFLASSLVFFTEILADIEILVENEKSNVSHDNNQLQLESNVVNRIHCIEDVIQNYFDRCKPDNTDSNKVSDWVINAILVMLATISVIIAFITFVVSIAIPKYLKMMNTLKQTVNALKQTEKKSNIQQQLDILLTRIELGVAQQELDNATKINEHDSNDDSGSDDGTKDPVAAAYTIALQIRSILEEIRSNGKDVNVQVLCNRIQDFSVKDIKGTWVKDVREFLHLLLIGKLLDDDSAQQAVKDLLRDL